MKQGTFDWRRQWYPVALLDYLDPKMPHPLELLGERLVLWRDAKQRWCCFEDKCPHRLAPLSGANLHIEATTRMHDGGFGITASRCIFLCCMQMNRSTQVPACRGPHRAQRRDADVLLPWLALHWRGEVHRCAPVDRCNGQRRRLRQPPLLRYCQAPEGTKALLESLPN